MQLIYATTPVDNAEGRTVKNPRFFRVVVKDATKVFIDGDHPKVKAAYEEAGIPVASIDDMRALPKTSKAPAASEPPKA